jgi:hypothetical protein
MVARIDDVSKSKKEWLNFHPLYPYCLMGRLAWSKNVIDKRDSPWQIIVGGDEFRLDVLLRFAIYLELACESAFYRSNKQEFTFFAHQGDTPNRVNHQASATLKKKVIDNPSFQRIFETTGRFQMSGDKHKSAKTGSHSFRKYAKTRGRRTGYCSKDEVDLRGRWKLDNSKPSSTYEDTCMPFTDAKVAFQLCPGGPIGYDLVPDSGLSDEWIAEKVTPNISAVYGSKMAAILGKALLWACCDDDGKTIVDRNLLQKVLTSYEAHKDGSVIIDNPVRKVGLILRESNGIAIIESCGVSPSNDQNTATATATVHDITRQRLQMVERKVDNLTQSVANLHNTVTQEFADNAMLLRKMDRLQRRMAAVPAVRRQGKTSNDAVLEGGEELPPNGPRPIVRRDLLSKCPKDLFILWKEYEFSLEGRKPAKLFTSVEKGMVSSVYSKRHKVWKLIQDLINKRNEDSRVVIDSIYAAYGNVSVTKIFKNIQRDEKTGGHPNLR